MSEHLKLDRSQVKVFKKNLMHRMKALEELLEDLDSKDDFTVCRAVAIGEPILWFFKNFRDMFNDTLKSASLICHPDLKDSTCRFEEQQGLRNFIPEHHPIIQHDEDECSHCKENEDEYEDERQEALKEFLKTILKGKH